MNATPLPGTSTNLRPGMQSNTNQQRLGVGVQRQQQSRCKANVYGYPFIAHISSSRRFRPRIATKKSQPSKGRAQQRGNDSSNLTYSNQASFHKCILKLCYVLSEVFNTPQHHYNQAVLEPGQMKPQQTHLVILI